MTDEWQLALVAGLTTGNTGAGGLSRVTELSCTLIVVMVTPHIHLSKLSELYR